MNDHFARQMLWQRSAFWRTTLICGDLALRAEILRRLFCGGGLELKRQQDLLLRRRTPAFGAAAVELCTEQAKLLTQQLVLLDSCSQHLIQCRKGSLVGRWNLLPEVGRQERFVRGVRHTGLVPAGAAFSCPLLKIFATDQKTAVYCSGLWALPWQISRPSRSHCSSR